MPTTGGSKCSSGSSSDRFGLAKDIFMQNLRLLFALLIPSLTFSQSTPGPYKVLKTAKVGGEGGFDYVYADADGRRLYIPRGATQGTPPKPARVSVFDLDTLAVAGEIPDANARGAAVDPKSGH